jgi:hypothetical protein
MAGFLPGEVILRFGRYLFMKALLSGVHFCLHGQNGEVGRPLFDVLLFV